MDDKLFEEHSLRKNLFSVDKLRYAKGDRPKVECILCGVIHKDPIVSNLTIFESELTVVSVNLFPYNPGHLILFPKRHITHYKDLTTAEASDIHELTQKSIQVIEREWRAKGFNIGYNLGDNAGGSIPHIHQHIVPRFPNEAGFMDVLSNTRVVIYEPQKMVDELRLAWNR